MKFTYFLNAFLATLAIASPISSGRDEETGLAARADDEVLTDNYKAVAAAHPGLQKDKYYYFTIKNSLPDKVENGDAETLTELQQLQKNLGFDHIGVLVGQVTETTRTKPGGKKGKPGKKTTTKDFKGFYIHMTKGKDGKTAQHTSVWSDRGAQSNQKIEYVGTTTKKGEDKAKAEAKAYVEEEDHKVYNIQNNNCNSFAQAILGALR
ncbi:hypothetical protein F5Y13DRAFT_168055 [Hypoxylon sp. FL1857]|nr:hypothetical protein F5Y13DRAFT_168055 [Hypoxylon sp. FL1857]